MQVDDMEPPENIMETISLPTEDAVCVKEQVKRWEEQNAKRPRTTSATSTDVATNIGATSAELGDGSGRALKPSSEDPGNAEALPTTEDAMQPEPEAGEAKNEAMEGITVASPTLQRCCQIPLTALAMGDHKNWKELHRRLKDLPVFPTELPEVNRLLAEHEEGVLSSLVRAEIAKTITATLTKIRDFLNSREDAIEYYNTGLFNAHGECRDSQNNVCFNAFEFPCIHLVAGTTLDST